MKRALDGPISIGEARVAHEREDTMAQALDEPNLFELAGEYTQIS